MGVSLDDTEDADDFDYDDVCGISACPYYQTFFASQRGAPYLRGVISLPPVDHGTSLRLQPLLHKNGSGPDWVFAVTEGCGSSEELVGCLVAQARRDTPGEWELGYF